MARAKGVWLSVYVEKPKKNISQSRNNHHHHLYVTGNGGGYNRKAQLLEYSRQLRESARLQASSPLLHPKPVSHDHQQDLRQVGKNKGFLSKKYASLRKYR